MRTADYLKWKTRPKPFWIAVGTMRISDEVFMPVIRNKNPGR